VVPRSSITDKEPRSDDLSKYKVCDSGDIVLNRFNAYRGALGRVTNRGIVSPDYLVLRPTLSGHSGYLTYRLLATDFSHAMKASMGGLGAADPDSSGFSRIDVRALMRSRTVRLSFEEQRQIADYLDGQTAKIDALISKQEQLIETLAERRQAVISHAVTKGLDPNAPMRDSGVEWLGAIPSKWRAVPIRWFARLITGKTPDSTDESNYEDTEDGIPWVRPEDLRESGIQTVASKHLSRQGVEQLRVVSPGATLLCCIGATLGKAGMVSRSCTTNQQITAIEGDSNARFLFYSILAARQELILQSVGNTLPILNAFRLGGVALPRPDKDAGARIVAYLDQETTKIDALSAKAREMIDVLKERRQALISAAVTGKIDVRGLA
jgi:type I restriction enzyme S subunit